MIEEQFRIAHIKDNPEFEKMIKEKITKLIKINQKWPKFYLGQEPKLLLMWSFSLKKGKELILTGITLDGNVVRSKIYAIYPGFVRNGCMPVFDVIGGSCAKPPFVCYRLNKTVAESTFARIMDMFNHHDDYDRLHFNMTEELIKESL